LAAGNFQQAAARLSTINAAPVITQAGRAAFVNRALFDSAWLTAIVCHSHRHNRLKTAARWGKRVSA